MIGILGRDPEGWGTSQLKASLEKRGVASQFLGFQDLVTRVGSQPNISTRDIDVVKDMPALLVRPIGRGSLEEIIFRMDLLLSLERRGILIVNPPRTIERCVDKYFALTLLEENGLPVPRTVVTENLEEALKGFQELGGDVVLKPLFGSRGVGTTRIADLNVAERIFGSIRFHHGVIYLQEFIPHGSSDIRAFVVGENVVAAMKRVGDSWKANVSQGAKPVSIRLTEELEKLAIESAGVIGVKVSGVDILEGINGPLVVELNSQPGWRGLQSVTKINIADCIVNYVISEMRR